MTDIRAEKLASIKKYNYMAWCDFQIGETWQTRIFREEDQEKLDAAIVKFFETKPEAANVITTYSNITDHVFLKRVAWVKEDPATGKLGHNHEEQKGIEV